MKTRLVTASRLVVKVGSALVTGNGNGLDLAAIADWARQISVLRRQGKEVVLVSSGAIACGMQRLGWTQAAEGGARTAGGGGGRPDGADPGL